MMRPAISSMTSVHALAMKTSTQDCHMRRTLTYRRPETSLAGLRAGGVAGVIDHDGFVESVCDGTSSTDCHHRHGNCEQGASKFRLHRHHVQHCDVVRHEHVATDR